MESRAGIGRSGGREERDPLSNNSSRAHTTSPVLGWFGHVTMTMNSRHCKHKMLSKMSPEQALRNCQQASPAKGGFKNPLRPA